MPRSTPTVKPDPPPPPGERAEDELHGAAAAAALQQALPSLCLPERVRGRVVDIQGRRDIDTSVTLTFTLTDSQFRNIHVQLTSEAARALYVRLGRVVARVVTEP